MHQVTDANQRNTKAYINWVQIPYVAMSTFNWLDQKVWIHQSSEFKQTVKWKKHCCSHKTEQFHWEKIYLWIGHLNNSWLITLTWIKTIGIILTAKAIVFGLISNFFAKKKKKRFWKQVWISYKKICNTYSLNRLRTDIQIHIMVIKYQFVRPLFS